MNGALSALPELRRRTPIAISQSRVIVQCLQTDHSLWPAQQTMSSPVSPSAMFSMSPKSPAPFTATEHPETLPAFPIEVQKRIIHFALNLEPRYTFTLEKETKAPLTGLVARQNDTRRVVERLNTHRSALNLMRVCKAWKVS